MMNTNFFLGIDLGTTDKVKYISQIQFHKK